MKSVMKRTMIIGLLLGGIAALPRTGVAASDAAQAILLESGISGGFVVHVGCGDGQLTAALKANDAYVVHGLDTDSEAVAKARKRMASIPHAGTLSAAVFDGRNLPYIDNMVNLVYLSQRYDLTDKELLRVLAPRGKAIIPKTGVRSQESGD